MVLTESQLETALRRPGREPRIGIAVVLAVLIFVGIGFLTDPNAGEDEPLGSADGPLQVIERWVETYNSGQIDSLLALYTNDAVINGTLLSLDQDYIRGVHSLNMSWNEKLSLSDCAEVEIAAFRCSYERANEMLARAGVTASGLIEFGFGQSESIRRSDMTVVNPESTAFVDGFSTWVEDFHPEIEITTRFGELLIDEAPSQILALVDEFVEQSDVYPLPG